MKLVTHNLGCNLHQAATWINDYNLAQYVLMMDCARGENTIVVLRVDKDFDLDVWLDAHSTRARERRAERERKMKS